MKLFRGCEEYKRGVGSQTGHVLELQEVQLLRAQMKAVPGGLRDKIFRNREGGHRRKKPQGPREQEGWDMGMAQEGGGRRPVLGGCRPVLQTYPESLAGGRPVWLRKK